MNKYKINIHAHSYFSDGLNSPYKMALEAKQIGFSALVITDHWYNKECSVSMNRDRHDILKRGLGESKKIIPVIMGLELPVDDGNEILVFGGGAIKAIISEGNSSFSFSMLMALKKVEHCSFILCHPRGQVSEECVELVDGFEAYNSGQNLFEKRGFGALRNLPAWSNSDAHRYQELKEGWNLIDTKVETEAQLIKYIKSGKQPEMIAKGSPVTG